jgi:hypothetical protein
MQLSTPPTGSAEGGRSAATPTAGDGNAGAAIGWAAAHADLQRIKQDAALSEYFTHPAVGFFYSFSIQIAYDLP